MNAVRKKPKYIVADRDAKSRFVAVDDPRLDIEPDVEVNIRVDIMSDEGPVARSNPHNKPDKTADRDERR